MTTYHDPINLLRDYTTSNKKIDLVGGKLYFNNLEIPMNHETAWKSPHSNKQYSIGSIWFFLQNHQIEFKEYAKGCTKNQIEMVSRPDKSEILAYFQGEIEHSNCIDEEVRPSTLVKKVIEENKVNNREALERPLCTKESILQTPSTSYKYLITYCKENMKQSKRQRESTSFSLIQEILNGPDKSPEYLPRPIIIVPTTANPGGLCLLNAVQFLEKGNFIDSSQLEGQHISGPLQFTHKLKGRLITFEVYDQILSFTKSHWRRTVAVLVQGPRYQFKDWPLSQDLITLFQTFRGFYINYGDSPIEENVKKWNVRTLQISRNKRHLDKTVQHEFWDELEKFLFSVRFKGNKGKID